MTTQQVADDVRARAAAASDAGGVEQSGIGEGTRPSALGNADELREMLAEFRDDLQGRMDKLYDSVNGRLTPVEQLRSELTEMVGDTRRMRHEINVFLDEEQGPERREQARKLIDQKIADEQKDAELTRLRREEEERGQDDGTDPRQSIIERDYPAINRALRVDAEDEKVTFEDVVRSKYWPTDAVPNTADEAAFEQYFRNFQRKAKAAIKSFADDVHKSTRVQVPTQLPAGGGDDDAVWLGRYNAGRDGGIEVSRENAVRARDLKAKGVVPVPYRGG